MYLFDHQTQCIVALSLLSVQCPFLEIFVRIFGIMSGSVDAENQNKEVPEDSQKEIIGAIKALLFDE